MHQVIHWVEIASDVVDVLLLLRFLLLRFFPTYAFVILYSAITVLFDGVSLAISPETELAARIFLYSRLIVAFVFPLAAWEVFELAPTKVTKLRQLQAIRLVGGLFAMAIFAAAVVFLTAEDSTPAVDLFGQVGLLLWPTSAVASLMFLWTMRRLLRAQQIELAGNTRVLAVFFAFAFTAEIISFILTMVEAQFKLELGIAEILLNSAFMALCFWCMLRLKTLKVTEVPESPAGTK